MTDEEKMSTCSSEQTLDELEQECNTYKQRCESLEQQLSQLRSQLDQQAELQKILYDQIDSEKEALSNQFSRQLAECEYAKTELYREVYKYKLQLRTQETTLSVDVDEVEVLSSQLALVKSERSVLTQQRDLFADELSKLLARHEAQLVRDAEQEHAIARLQSKLSSSAAQVTHLQGQISSMTSQRDDSELRHLKRQVAEMNARLEQSERRNAESAQLIAAHERAAAKEAAARKEKAADIAAAAATAAASATSALAASVNSSSAVAATLSGATEKASKKRKEREDQLHRESRALAEPAEEPTAVTEEEDDEQSHVQQAEKHDQKKKKKSKEVSSDAHHAEEDARAREQEERESQLQKEQQAKEEKAARKKERREQREQAAAAAAVHASEPVVVADSKKSKRKKQSAVDEDENGDAAWLADDDITSIAGKWNVKVSADAPTRAPALPRPAPARAATSRGGLESLALSPIARVDDDLPGVSAGGRVRSRLATNDAALDAAASDAAVNSSLDDSLASVDSVTGERRRKLFPTKRTHRPTAVDLLPSPVVSRFNEKTASLQSAHSSRVPLQSVHSQPQAASSAPFNPLHKSSSLPQAPRPLVGMPAAPSSAASTRNLFMHFLGGAMKVPKIKQNA